jgi:acetyl-CoA carboxylase carboxyl transferase subunit alpha
MVLEFEKPIADLEQKLQEMKELAVGRKIDLSSDIASLEDKIHDLKKETFQNLTRWQRVQLS